MLKIACNLNLGKINNCFVSMSDAMVRNVNYDIDTIIVLFFVFGTVYGKILTSVAMIYALFYAYFRTKQCD
jgi:uncharacterized membrane protein YciS (DUF1049 family)